SCTLTLHIIHSFPTRRSSDLPLRRQEERGDPVELLVVARVRSHEKGLRKGLIKPDDRVRDRPQATEHQLRLLEVVRLARLQDDQDRKSTRLNSSHVAISYAVF